MVGFACKYLILPVFQGTGYNPVNTLVLAGLFYLLALSSYRYLKTVAGIKSVDYFAWSALPYIILGGLMRALTDAGVYPGYSWPASLCGTTVNLSKAIFVTPGAYLLPISILFTSLLFERVSKKRGIAARSGWLLVALNLFLLKPVRTEAILGTLAVAAVVSAAAIVLFKTLVKLKFMEDLYSRLALSAQLFEASATFVGVSFFGYGEQHVLAGLAIGWAGPASLFLVKMGVVPFVLWACEELEPDMKKYVRILIMALGLGPGLRDVLSVAMGV